MARKRSGQKGTLGKPPNRRPVVNPAPAQSAKILPPARGRRLQTLAQWIGRGLVAIALVMTVAVGVWMYYPRSANFLSMGIQVESDCTAPPTVKLGAMWMDVDSYTLTTSFDYPRDAGCKSIQIMTPGPFSRLTLVKPIDKDPNKVTWQDIQSSRQPLPPASYRVRHNEVGQPIIEIDVQSLGEKPTQIDMRLHQIHRDRFEKFKLIIPAAFTVNGRREVSGMKEVSLLLESIAISPDFEVNDVQPTPTGKRGSLGSEIIYFGGTKLSELNVTITSTTLEWWKQVYSLVGIGVVCSLIAAVIYSWFTSRS